jgi:hypothetical protein
MSAESTNCIRTSLLACLLLCSSAVSRSAWCFFRWAEIQAAAALELQEWAHCKPHCGKLGMADCDLHSQISINSLWSVCFVINAHPNRNLFIYLKIGNTIWKLKNNANDSNKLELYDHLSRWLMILSLSSSCIAHRDFLHQGIKKNLWLQAVCLPGVLLK